MMNTINILVALSWLVFLIYWGISAISAKKTTNRGSGFLMRIILICLFGLVIAVSHFSPKGHLFLRYSQPLASLPLRIFGLVLCIIGVSLAIYARKYLGRNWGMPMSHKEDGELVTSGPYSVIRHPIYTGVMMALLGTGLASYPLWIAFSVIGCIYFIFSAIQEEKRMLREFSGEYPAYMARTKRLIPLIY